VSTAALRKEGRHRVDVRVGGRGETHAIRVRDVLVVVIGDSVAAGEGNVAKLPLPAWADRRCHRSQAAAGERAARRVVTAARRRGRHFALTFISLACSGATVKNGLLGRFGGQEPLRDDRELEPQVKRLSRLDHENPVAAVIVSIGANDVHFGPIVRACARLKSCAGKETRLEPGGPKAKISDQVSAALGELPKGYATLAKELKPIVPSRRVVITEYFDPTRSDDAQLCKHVDIQLDAGEFAFASRSVLRPLNAAVAAAAREHGWQLVPMVSTDFQEHGYCAHDRWVVRVTESLLKSRGSPLLKRALGTLHPNENGQLAISARLAPRLARTLWPRQTVPRPVIATSNEVLKADHDPWWQQLAIAVGVLLAFIITWPAVFVLLARVMWLLTWIWKVLVRRPVRLLMHSGQPDPMESGPPDDWAIDANWNVIAACVFAGLIGALVLGGHAIERVRLWAAHLPSSGRLYTDGWGLELGARAMWASAAVVVVAIAYVVSKEGHPRRKTRRLIGIVLFAGMGVTIWVLQDLSMAQRLELTLALIVLVQFGHYLVQRVLEAIAPGRSTFFRVMHSLDGAPWWRYAVRGVPLGLCLVAIGIAVIAGGGQGRTVAALVVVLAAILIVAPGGVASGATSRRRARLRPARDWLAASGFIVACLFVWQTERALLLTGLVAAALAVGCIYVAALSADHFAPFAAVFAFAVLAFGAVEETFDEFRSPAGLGFAAVTPQGQLICGVKLGTDGDRTIIAAVTLDDRGRVMKGHATVRPVSSDATAEISDRLPIGRALRSATRDLAAQHPSRPANAATNRSCPWPPRPPTASATDSDARRFVPRFMVDNKDGFWPVPVATLFSLEGRAGPVCLQRRGRDHCTRLARAADLPWRGAADDRIIHPARMDRDDEQTLTERALGSAAFANHAAIYYLNRTTPKSVAIQYWTFFTYDYLPLWDHAPLIHTVEAGSHQGDWEHVGVVASGTSKTPRYVWMSRHNAADEGRPFAWEENGLDHKRGHPRVFVAKGSHASYDHCGVQVRDLDRFHLIDETSTCDTERLRELSPKQTPLIDLAQTPWACFAGTFGRTQRGFLEKKIQIHLIENAPRGPLLQQTFDHVPAAPCEHVPEPATRDGATEEVLPTATAARLREHAGEMEHWFDGCDDWEKPATRGSYLVVCEQKELDAFFKGGLETIPLDGPWIGEGTQRGKPITLPAVRRSLAPSALRTWRIHGGVTHATVYAARRDRKNTKTYAARFVNVTLKPGQVLRVDERDDRWWRLIDNAAEGDPPIADAPVDVVSGR
jgi:lysophospholipase L1-like esterase